MKQFILILFLIRVSGGFAQEKIPYDSLKYFIIDDTVKAQFQIANEFLEVKNTSKGIVLYRPASYMLKFHQNLDSIRELDGFEFYNWKITNKDSLDNRTLKLLGTCPLQWGKNYAVFTFTNIDSGLILYKRKIYDENGKILMHFEKLIIEKIHINKFVCFKEPNPNYPGTKLPFIDLDLKNIVIAQKGDFEIKKR